MRHSGVFSGLVLAAVLVSACASGERAMTRTAEGLPGAVATPLTDLNITRTEIPQRLALIRSPYEALPVANCRTLAVEVIELTNILGPDVDQDQTKETIELQMGNDAAQMILRQVTTTMADFIPFRSALREATGATAHERRLRLAYERGVTRRSYLKGVGAQMGCAPPAAPQPGAGFAQPVPPPARAPAQSPPRSSGRSN